VWAFEEILVEVNKKSWDEKLVMRKFDLWKRR